MFAFIKLTRPLNLLIIALTMFLMRFGVIEGNLRRGLHQLLGALDSPYSPADLTFTTGLSATMPIVHFILLVLSTMLIAGAGNVINDYFDTRIDRINKPDEVIVGRQVKRRVAMTAHLVMSAIGLLLAAFVAWRSGLPQWILIPMFAIMALWSYSTHLKKRLIIGNTVVALLTALVPLTVGLYEIPMLKQAFSTKQTVHFPNGDVFEVLPAFNELWYWIIGYAVFAFIATLVRELQKDMADVQGDRAEGCRTVPIVWGIKWARALVLLYILFLIVGILFVRTILPDDRITYWYLGIGVLGPLLLSAGLTYTAQWRHEHVRAGTMMKFAMVMAVGYALLIPYLP